MIHIDDKTPIKLRQFFIDVRNMERAAVDYRHGHQFDGGYISFSKEDMCDIELLQSFLIGFQQREGGFLHREFDGVNVRITITDGIKFTKDYCIIKTNDEGKVEVIKTPGVYILTGDIDVKYWIERVSAE